MSTTRDVVAHHVSRPTIECKRKVPDRGVIPHIWERTARCFTALETIIDASHKAELWSGPGVAANLADMRANHRVLTPSWPFTLRPTPEGAEPFNRLARKIDALGQVIAAGGNVEGACRAMGMEAIAIKARLTQAKLAISAALDEVVANWPVIDERWTQKARRMEALWAHQDSQPSHRRAV